MGLKCLDTLLLYFPRNILAGIIYVRFKLSCSQIEIEFILRAPPSKSVSV